MKTLSKVKSVVASGTYENPNGVDLGNNKIGFYKFEYEFEDTETLTANHKSQTPFAVGTEVEYEIVRNHPTYGNSGKVSKPSEGNYNPKPQGDNLKGIKIGHAITNAVSLHCALGHPDGHPNTKDSIKEYAKMIYQISEELNTEI